MYNSWRRSASARRLIQSRRFHQRFASSDGAAAAATAAAAAASAFLLSFLDEAMTTTIEETTDEKKEITDKQQQQQQQQQQQLADESLWSVFQNVFSAGMIQCEQSTATATATAAAAAAATAAATTTSSSDNSDGSLLDRIRASMRTSENNVDNADSWLQTRYKVRSWSRPLGVGAFGTVYLATDKASNEKVALKKIPKEFTSDAGFMREMSALLHVREEGGHPHICGLRENFEEGRHYYLTLDLISGGEMFDHLVKMGAYSEADASRLIREVASALAFLHGIGVVHGDMKPENLMLSTSKASDAVIKLVDFGCAQVITNEQEREVAKGNFAQQNTYTPAYCPPEVLDHHQSVSNVMEASMDMWALGIILYIMLTGLHPFDLTGTATDQEISKRIMQHKPPPLGNSPITAHLSPSALDLIERLISWDPKKRITALEMLAHPWVQGKTASHDKMENSDKRLSMYRSFKSRLEKQVFADIVKWSDQIHQKENISKRTSLLERSFRALDGNQKGYITSKDLKRHIGEDIDTDSAAQPLTMASFSDLLSDNMKNTYFPKGHVVYKEGDEGNHMYFINSGTIEVLTEKENWKTRRSQGDFFGEGALMNPRKIRSATVRCATPVHAIEISREYFEKYLADDHGLKRNLKEKDKTRKRNRAKNILRLQNSLKERTIKQGEYVYRFGAEGSELFVLEEGEVDVTVEDRTVFTLQPGDLCGEHSLIFGRPRNTSALCHSKECKMQVMRALDFYKFLDSTPAARESLQDMCLRREFQKALVFYTKKPFPTNEHDLRLVFEMVDVEGTGQITLHHTRKMLRRMDPTLTEEDIQAILKSLDLDDSNAVSYESFQRIFGGTAHQAASK